MAHVKCDGEEDDFLSKYLEREMRKLGTEIIDIKAKRILTAEIWSDLLRNPLKALTHLHISLILQFYSDHFR